MISVLTGTQDMPFDRLIKGVSQDWSELERFKPVFIQRGSSKEVRGPNWVTVFDYCHRKEVGALLSDSEYCITHGGTGSIVGALEAGCKVAVMPRLKKYGEHNDDHQVEIAELFEEAGLVIYWRECMSIHDVLQRLERFEPEQYRSEFAGLRNSVASDIKEFLARPD